MTRKLKLPSEEKRILPQSSYQDYFQPEAKFREFDCRKYVGRTVELSLEHTNQEKNNQYVRMELKEDPIWSPGDWAGKILGPKDSKIKAKIISCKLIEASNGGRGDYRLFDSYREFFSEERKKIVHDSWTGGLMGKILGRGGDPDRADIIFTLEGGMKIEDRCWGMSAPEEWYSELHVNNSKFKFVDGFYESAEAAIAAFSQKSSDDMFGERYFPTIVFPFGTLAETVRGIASGPKSCSKPIVTKNWVIYGTRCKPYEYTETISATYDNGGKVPIGVTWDWD